MKLKKCKSHTSKTDSSIFHITSFTNVTRIMSEMWRRAKKSFAASIVLVLLFLYVFSTATPLAETQVPKKIEVVILENGIFDTFSVITAITGYATSIESSLGFDCNIIKLPSQNNDPQGIDDFIQSRYSDGTKLFILVGNDLRWPLSIANIDPSTLGAVPADGVLCDTDGEISIEDDGLHQYIEPFTAEATISYIFPPKTGITPETQINFVVNAFEKFSKYHQRKLTYGTKGVVCGHFSSPPDPLGFQRAIDNMTLACEQIFGKENVTKKELDSSEIKTYLEHAPAFFGVAGHGSPQLVETSSLGDYLTWDNLALSGKGPMLLEIFGCWTGGWEIRNENDPWDAVRGFLSEAGIFENIFNIAMISGNPGPEANAERSFSNLVLSQIPIHPEATIGELMIGKKRWNTDWILFGDPLLRFDITGNEYVNQRPIAYIDSISPNPAEEGTSVYFEGHATDIDGKIIDYRWRSSLDGELSRSAAFTTQDLSVGTHNIYFKAQDDYWDWSEEAFKQLTIVAKSPVTILSPADGETVKGTIVISVSTTLKNVIAVNFYIDGAYRGYDGASPYQYSWDTMLYSNGQHTIQAYAYTNLPVMTYSSKKITVTVNNPVPTVTIIAPSDGSTVSGTCSIDVIAEDSAKVSKVRFFIDGIAKGYDYSSPFQWFWDTTSYSNGPHIVHVDAFYTNIYRYISSPQITVFVNNQQIPQRTVTITYPSSGTTVAGTVIINVEATGDNLQRIYLYVDGNWMGYDATPPYQFNWNTVSLSDGPHQIYAIGLYEERPPHVQIKSETITLIVDNSV